MAANEYKVPTYPVVSFLVAHGLILSALIGALPVAAGIYLALTGWPLSVAAAGLGAGIVLAGLLASYVEVLRIIADTLMPK